MKTNKIILIFAIILLALLPFVNALTTNYQDFVNAEATLDGADARKAGISIAPLQANISIYGVNKSSSSTATSCYMYLNYTGSPILQTSGTFSGNQCNFTTPYNITNSTQLTSTKAIWLVTDNGGSVRQLYRTASPGFPFNTVTYANFSVKCGAFFGTTNDCYTSNSYEITAILFSITTSTPSTTPNIQFQGQTPNNNSVQYQIINNSFYVNTTTSGYGLVLSTSHYLYDSLGNLLQTNTNTSNPANLTSQFLGLSVGNYLYNATSVGVSQVGQFDGTRQGGQMGSTFNGSQSVLVSSSPGFLFTYPTTLEVCFNGVNDGNHRALVSIAPTSNNRIAIGWNAARQISMGIYNGSSYFVTGGTSTAKSDNTNYCFMAIFNGSSVISILNGVQDTGTNSPVTGTNQYAIGRHNANPGFLGNITKYVHWNGTLSLSQGLSETSISNMNLPTNLTDGLVLQYLLNRTESIFSNSSTVFNVNQSIVNTEKRTITFYNLSAGIINNSGSTLNNVQNIINLTWTNGTTNPINTYQINNYNLYIDNSFIGTSKTTNYSLYTYNLGLNLGTHNITLITNDTQSDQVNSSTTFTLVTNANLTINLTNNQTNTPIIGFKITVYEINTSTTTNYTTTSNSLTFNMIKGYSYNISIDAGQNYSLINYVYVSNQTTSQFATYQIYPYNSITINIYDEVSGARVTELIGIGIYSITNSYSYTTNTGYLLVNNISEGAYNIVFTQLSLNTTVYGSRTYTLTMTNSSHQTLDARLSTNSTLIEVYTRDITQNAIDSALITVQKTYSGSYLTIAQATTDINGYARFNLIEAVPYRLIIDAGGYTQKIFIMTFYGTNSPYTFVLTSTSSYIFTNVLNDVGFSYSPTNTSLNNGSTTFSFNTYSSTSILDWVSITTPQGTTNVSGTPAGMTPTRTESLINYAGQQYPVTYCFKATGYSVYCTTVTYVVQSTSTISNNLVISANSIKNDWSDQSGTSGLAILGTLLVLIIVLTLTQLTQNINLATIGGFFGMILFAFLGWFSVLQVSAMVIIGALLFFMNRSGGSY